MSYFTQNNNGTSDEKKIASTLEFVPHIYSAITQNLRQYQISLFKRKTVVKLNK